MSFFKDFKEDLSQAVNELLPEEKTEEVKTEEVKSTMEEMPQMVDTITEAEPVFDKDDIADMLKNIDTVPTVEAEVPVSEPEPVSAAAPVQTPVQEEPVFASEPSFTAETAFVAQPEVKPEPTPEITAPIQETAVPVQPEPISVPEQEPVKEAEPEIHTEEFTHIAPIFAQEPEERPAPINTTMEDGTMETGIIIAGMSVKGDITSEGSLDVQGNIKGNIDIKGKLEVTGTIEGNSSAEEVFADGAQIVGEINSNGSVKIGQSSVVRGNITAKSAVLAGAVKGDIDVQGPVILDTTAIIMGNIKSKSIQINNGAVIEGLCSQCYADVSPMTFFDDDKAPKAKAKKAE